MRWTEWLARLRQSREKPAPDQRPTVVICVLLAVSFPLFDWLVHVAVLPRAVLLLPYMNIRWAIAIIVAPPFCLWMYAMILVGKHISRWFGWSVG